MRLLADENVKGRLVRWLKASGHDVAVAPKRTKNSPLVELAGRDARVLLTNDTDFLNTALYPPQGSPGRIVLRIVPPTFVEQRERVAWLLTAFRAPDIAGKVVELRREGFELHTK